MFLFHLHWILRKSEFCLYTRKLIQYIWASFSPPINLALKTNGRLEGLGCQGERGGVYLNHKQLETYTQLHVLYTGTKKDEYNMKSTL